MAHAIVDDLKEQVMLGTPVLGEILTWNVGLGGKRVGYQRIADALRSCELPDKYARQLCPRYAFARACRKLEQQRIIRVVKEEGEELKFQFTAERKGDDGFAYEKETMLTLNKKSGAITCDIPGIATEAKELLDECIGNRTASDITNIVQRLFEKNADLFQVRDQGGAYFVPENHLPFVDKVERFLVAMGGKMNRFPIPLGTVHGDSAVKDVVSAGLSGMIADHRRAISKFGNETGEKALTSAAERIKLTKLKLECYAAFLDERRESLELELERANVELRAKFCAIATEEAA